MSAPSAPLRILLVEDEPADAAWLEVRFAELGEFEPSRAATLREAVTRLRELAFDAVLLDLGLPDSRGEATLGALRAAAPHVPVVVLTGARDFELGVRCVDLGAQDFLSKGEELDAHEIRRALHHAIARTREQVLTSVRRELDGARMLDFGEAPSAPLSVRDPARYQSLARRYAEVLPAHTGAMDRARARPSEAIAALVTELHDARCGPADLVEMQLEAIEQLIDSLPVEEGRDFAPRARLAGVEVMGRLLERYRASG